ncbi:MAG TPA: hypothetical protein VEW64_01580 [Methyloceanibacter sp.]|jgi:hypothetical protein|nr:hypothetical protein [Methyloceanibacter sp.]
MTRIIALALCAVLFSFLPVSAQVVTDHLLGKYAMTDDGCQEGATEFEIRRGIVEGPNVFCILGATKPTDIGTEAYEANCKQPGAIGTLTFDLSGKPERIKIMLPERQEWITLYICK